MEDNELRQMMSLMETYKQRSEILERQVNVLRNSLTEVSMASAAIKTLLEANEGDDIMVPIGATSFVNVKVTSNKNVIVDVGSNISVEKSPEDAKQFMEANAAELSEALKKTMEAVQEVQKALETVTEAVQQEYINRQETPANPIQ